LLFSTFITLLVMPVLFAFVEKTETPAA